MEIRNNHKQVVPRKIVRKLSEKRRQFLHRDGALLGSCHVTKDDGRGFYLVLADDDSPWDFKVICLAELSFKTLG
jgi:hypothetical protein